MWGMRAYVMARKGLLMSSPDVRNMTSTQWVFEYHALHDKEEMYMDVFTKLMRGVLINVLGLNSLKPETEAGDPKKWDDMTAEEKDQFLPLIAWCGRTEMLKSLQEQLQKTKINEEVPRDDKEYERTVAAIDAAGGDMEAIIPEFPMAAKIAQDKKALGIKDLDDLPGDMDVDVGDF